MPRISGLVRARLRTGRLSSRLFAHAVLAMAVMSISVFSAVPSVAGQTVTGSLTFKRGEDNVLSGLIDTLHGFAYFATDTQPGIIVKVRLSDFTKSGSLVLNQGEDSLSAAIIDAANGFAYFGTYKLGNPYGSIVKVRLSDLTRVGSITVNSPLGHFTTAVIDTVNGYAYFGGFNLRGGLEGSNGLVVRVRLSDFTLVGTLSLPNGRELFGSAIGGDGFAYFSTSSTPAAIYKIRLSDFNLANSLVVGEPLGATPLIDPTTGLSYWPTESDPGSVLRVRLSDMALTGNLTLKPGEASPNSGIIDPSEGYVYFGTQGTRGLSSEIVKINVANFKRTATLALAPYESLLFLSAAGMIQTEAVGGTFAYFGTYTTPSYIIKVRLSSMNRVGTLKLQQGEQAFDNSVIDTAAGFVYFGSDTVFGTGSATSAISRIRTSDFSDAGTLTLNPGEGPLCSAVIDTTNGFAYFGTDTSPSKIIKVRLSDFSRVGAVTLNTGEDFACTGVIDTLNGFAYFGTLSSPSSVVKVRLSDFTRVGAVTLAPGEDALISSLIDVGAGFAYFGTEGFPGIISKVRLSDLTEVGSLTLNSEEDLPFAAAIDPAGGFAYFGTLEASIVRIRLSDFSENMTLTLSGCCLFNLASVVLDVSRGFGYFGGEGFIAKVQLSNLTEVGSISTPSPNDFLTSASIDVAAGTAYFGVFSSPAKVYRVSL